MKIGFERIFLITLYFIIPSFVETSTMITAGESSVCICTETIYPSKFVLFGLSALFEKM